MTSVKEYLGQLKVLEIKIRQKKDELESLIAESESVSINLGEKVQTSAVNQLSEIVSKIVDLKMEIDQEVLKLLEKRNEIIELIHRLNNPLFIDVLYKRYVQYKTFEDIAEETKYSVRQIHRIHGYALSSIKKQMERCH